MLELKRERFWPGERGASAGSRERSARAKQLCCGALEETQRERRYGGLIEPPSGLH